MYTDTLVHEFATLVYCVFSADGRLLTYSNAGHPPPLLLRGERFIELGEGGLAIGVEPGEQFEQQEMQIESGDALIMVTDGVMDAMDYDGEMFGKERLLAAIWKHRHLKADSLARQILWDVRRFAGLADQSDDITVVVVRAG
jgi:sigma-B regulation protein RsbU (phosphoserine phosphatase)